MKPATLVLLLFILGACTGHYDADDFDLVKLGNAVPQLFNCPVNRNRIEKKCWPSEIVELNPESVRKSEQGIYIELNSFFVIERGLFIPTPGTKVQTGKHHDPYYRLLGNGIYSYHVTG